MILLKSLIKSAMMNLSNNWEVYSCLLHRSNQIVVVVGRVFVGSLIVVVLKMSEITTI